MSVETLNMASHEDGGAIEVDIPVSWLSRNFFLFHRPTHQRIGAGQGPLSQDRNLVRPHNDSRGHGSNRPFHIRRSDFPSPWPGTPVPEVTLPSGVPQVMQNCASSLLCAPHRPHLIRSGFLLTQWCDLPPSERTPNMPG